MVVLRGTILVATATALCVLARRVATAVGRYERPAFKQI